MADENCQEASSAVSSAGVTVSGRIVSAEGYGVFRASVSLTGANGETHTTLTNYFGYYRFSDVAAGATYVLSVFHKYYRFESESLNLNKEAAEDFNLKAQS